jgi:arginase family enzyme
MADIAELSPAFDIDHRTAKLAARLAGKIVQRIAQ